MVSEENLIIQSVKKGTPFLLKAISILLLIEGIIGFFFFTLVLIYHFINPDFLSGWGYGEYSGANLYLILSIYSIVHLGLIYSAILILKRKRQGIYIFILSLIVVTLTSYLLHGEVNWVGIFIGLAITLLILILWKSFE